jgi:hypothetical protein
MSLAQHVTATEGVDRDELQAADDECGEPTWRRLSYDAFAPAESILSVVPLPLNEPAPHIAAYKISPARRVGKDSRDHLVMQIIPKTHGSADEISTRLLPPLSLPSCVNLKR